MINNKGFTLVEVIVVVAVLAAVITMATPDINRLFSKQEEITEISRLKELRRAMEAYSKDRYQRLKDHKGIVKDLSAVPADLPDSDDWVKELSHYTDLTESQIETNVWGVKRYYKVEHEDRSYLGGKFRVFYGIISSVRKTRKSEADLGFQEARDMTERDSYENFNWTNSFAENRDNIESTGIEMLAVKYTDLSNKIKLLETTLSRMDKLSLALAKYARVMQISGFKNEPDLSDSYIYFPNDGSNAGSNHLYYKDVKEIANPHEATSLAEMLGLPKEYGEDALTGSTMWYISNPGADASNICNGATKAPFYPPVVMIDNDGDPCN